MGKRKLPNYFGYGIEQNKNFVQFRGAEKRIFAEMSVLAWLAAKTSFVWIVRFYGTGSVFTLPVLLLYYQYYNTM